MIKKNKLLIGCLSLLLVLSVGYALFSETVTINGTATAKGSFDITATCTSGVDEAYEEVYDDSGYHEYGFDSEFCEVSNETVSFGANLLYPSATKAFTIWFKNTGTIDAKLNLNDIVRDSQTCSDKDSDDIFENCISDEVFSYVFEAGVVKADGTKISADEDLSEFFDSETFELILSPSEQFVLVAVAKWPSLNEFSSEKYNGVAWRTTSSIKVPFEQYNN